MVVEQFEFQASSLLTDPSAASAAFEEHGLLVLRGLFVRDHLTDPPASQHIHCVSYAPARRHACASNLMDPAEKTVELREPGAFVVVPRGTWHTATVHAPSAGLFITAGEGTQHRPR